MAVTITPADLRRLRLVSHGLARTAASGHGAEPEDVVGRMLALQGQDLPGALRSIGLRTSDQTITDVRSAFDSGRLIRTWPFRGTLHVLRACDVNWVLRLTGQRTITASATRRAELGLTDVVLDRARQIATLALRSRPLLRGELLDCLTEGGLQTDSGRGYHLLFHLALTGTIVFGPFRGHDQQIVLCDGWVKNSRNLEGREAVRELVRLHLQGRGPATLADIAWWSKLPLRDLRPALEDLRTPGAGDGQTRSGPEISEVLSGGTTYWVHNSALEAAESSRIRSVVALPGFDEFLLGYTDRSGALDPRFAQRIVPGNNGVFKPTVVERGRVVGVWSKRQTPRLLKLRYEPFVQPASAAVLRGLATEGERLARFLEYDGEIQLDVDGTS